MAGRNDECKKRKNIITSQRNNEITKWQKSANINRSELPYEKKLVDFGNININTGTCI